MEPPGGEVRVQFDSNNRRKIMEAFATDWLTMLVRWMHLIFGAAWIGTSFYFNWLNHSFRPPQEEMKGVGGEVWSVHGGEFYRVVKYKVAPEKLPETLHWFKWEAYATWMTGFALLALVYYLGAESYLIDPSVADIGQGTAIGIGLGALVGSWFVYDLLCKSPLGKKPLAFGAVGFALMTAAAWGLCQVFSSRGAYIHVGAMLGTMMAANVFVVIIPNQRIMVDAMLKNEAPDGSLGKAASQRSLHNNYMTLPVLFIMISNHYPITYGHAWNWAILAALALIGGVARHHFNVKHKGRQQPWLLPAAAVAMFALAFVSSPALDKEAAGPPVAFTEVQKVLDQRCKTCHSAKPTFAGMTAPPAGLMYDSPEQVAAQAPRIRTALTTNFMPPGNITNLTQEERELVLRWIKQGADPKATGAAPKGDAH